MAIFDEKEIQKQAARSSKKLFPFSREGSKGEIKKKKEKPPEIKKSVTDIIPIIDQTKSGLFELKEEGGYFDIWQIQSTDVNSLNEEDANCHIYMLAKGYQGDEKSLKVVSLNLPVSTQKQQQFLQKKIKQSEDALFLRFLQKKLKELQYLEWGRTNREYFLFLYGDKETDVIARHAQFMRDVQSVLPLSTVSQEKKIDLLYKLYNQNAKLGNKQ